MYLFSINKSIQSRQDQDAEPVFNRNLTVPDVTKLFQVANTMEIVRKGYISFI